MKVADVTLTWNKSPSSDIVKTKVVTNINGDETVQEFDTNDVESFQLTISANSDFSYRIVSIDDEDNEVSSQTFTRRLGDLELPLPATNLALTINNVRDEEGVPLTSRKKKASD